MKMMQEILPVTQIGKDAEYAKQLVRGEKAPPGLLNQLNHWLNYTVLFEKDKNSFLPAEIALTYLRGGGFNEEQILMIRDAATAAGYTATNTMHKKYGEDVVPKKYISSMSAVFNVFCLYLNIGADIREEFNSLMCKLFDAKIDKMADKLIIQKNQ